MFHEQLWNAPVSPTRAVFPTATIGEPRGPEPARTVSPCSSRPRTLDWQTPSPTPNPSTSSPVCPGPTGPLPGNMPHCYRDRAELAHPYLATRRGFGGPREPRLAAENGRLGGTNR